MPWAPLYASADELREFVRIDDSADDDQIAAALDAASRSIDYACDPREGYERQFGKTDGQDARWYTATVRGYGVPVRGQWVVETDDIADATGLHVEIEDGTSPTVFVLGVVPLPRNADQRSRPFTAVGFAGSTVPSPSPLADAIRVTAVWGWPAVPATVREACLIQSSRLLARRDAPFGVAGSAETQSEMRLLARLDPDVENMIKPFVRKIGPVLA
ncbi:MAG TPA: hypothetical protein VIU11_09535 [Nakamurella sp.]